MQRNTVVKGLVWAGALAVGTSCQAQLGSGEYEVFGRLNLTAYNISGYTAGQPSQNKVNSVGSRVGFRYEKKFDESLTGTFRIEGGISADAGTGDIGSREVSAGLRGNLGWVRAGFMLTPLDDLHPIAGPGYLTSVTNDNISGFWANGYSNMFANGGTVGCTQVAGNGGNNSFGFDNRYGNSVRYDSPNVGGFTAATQLSLGEAKKSDGCNPYASSTKIQYEKDGLKAALAYNLHHNLRGMGLNDDIVMLAAGYQIGAAYNIGGYYQSVKYANPGKRNVTQDGSGLRGRAFFGPGTLELGWYHAGKGKGDQTATTTGIAMGDSTGANLYLVGYRHALNKTMELWSQVAVLKNGSASSYDIGGGGAGGTAATLGTSPRTLSVGIKYDF